MGCVLSNTVIPMCVVIHDHVLIIAFNNVTLIGKNMFMPTRVTNVCLASTVQSVSLKSITAHR